MNRPEFNECVEMLRSADSIIYEEGYHWLKGYLCDHIDELMQLMLDEADPEMRSKFVELVGNSKDPKVIRLLEAELQNPHSQVRSWAYSSLRYFENPEAERLAEEFRKEHPNEDFL
jgi:hypothetical protein